MDYMKLITLLVLLVISGCSAQYKAERALSRYGPYCQTLGFEPGTQSYAQCVLSKDNARKASSRR